MQDNQKEEITAQLKSIQGCLLGTAVGDALGLPFEGMSPERIKKIKTFTITTSIFL